MIFTEEHHSNKHLIRSFLSLITNRRFLSMMFGQDETVFEKAILETILELGSISDLSSTATKESLLGLLQDFSKPHSCISESRSSFSERKKQISKSKHLQSGLNHYKSFIVPFCKFSLEDLCELSAIWEWEHFQPTLWRETFSIQIWFEKLILMMIVIS